MFIETLSGAGLSGGFIDGKKRTCFSPGRKRIFLKTGTDFERMANTIPVMLYDSVLEPDGTSRFSLRGTCFLVVRFLN